MILTQEQELIRDSMRTFAQERLAPFAAEWDRNHTFPREALKELADNFVVTMPRIAAFLADHRTPFGRRVLASRCARACTCEGLPSDRQGDGRSATDRPEFGRYRPAFGQSASALDVRFQRRFRSAPFPR